MVVSGLVSESNALEAPFSRSFFISFREDRVTNAFSGAETVSVTGLDPVTHTGLHRVTSLVT